jgi:DNA topoisomerase-1
MLKLTGKKYTAEEAATLPLESVKAMIEAQVPGAFAKKATPTKKAAPKKKAAVKKK